MEIKKRLVDVDKAYARFAGLDAVGCDTWFLRDIENVLYKEPIVDAVEVVHGRWMKENEESIRCSECCFNRASIKIPLDYCPNCGSKMDGDKK